VNSAFKRKERRFIATSIPTESARLSIVRSFVEKLDAKFEGHYVLGSIKKASHTKGIIWTGSVKYNVVNCI
jgi:hypothetical protein